MERLSHAEVNRIRRTPGASILLFITDRCPVGCAHCSVDSRPESPRISNFDLFAGIVDQLCGQPRLDLVGISGGEPFVERRGLSLAVDRLVGAGKRIAIYTSGFWAAQEIPPPWIDEVLARTDCIYLSTDAYHEAGTAAGQFSNAARAVARHGIPIIVQVIDENGMVERARQLLVAAFGNDWSRCAEIIPTFPLPYGRGAGIYSWKHRFATRGFGVCNLATSPVVRYDGLVTACCNETVIMGGGPPALRRDCADGVETSKAVAEFRNDPFFRAVSDVGIGEMAVDHPEFQDLADKEFSSICGACWTMLRRRQETAGSRSLPVVEAGRSSS
ncbi:radical SAM protein [Kitasatospora sp. NPDC101235]|uniref:radical SAM protein n=1 Tax=Kitasatospora sp. NPDC101235 TaxID=3364101 RepID=UPI0038270422